MTILCRGLVKGSPHPVRNTTSGDFEVDRVDVHSVSGDIKVSATPTTDGAIDASTVSGNVTTRGTSHLRERVGTVCAKHRR